MTKKILLVIALLFTGNVYADDAEKQCASSIVTKDEAEYFQKSFEVATKLSKALCMHRIHAESISADTKHLADSWKRESIRETEKLRSADIDLRDVIDHLHDLYLSGRSYAYFAVTHNPALDIYFYDTSDYLVGTSEVKDNDACMEKFDGKKCNQILKQFESVSVAVLDYTRLETLRKVRVNLGLGKKKWENYFNKARSQTFIELSLNTWLYSDDVVGYLDKQDNATGNEKQKLDNTFVDPPDYQVILLHPGIAIDYVTDAPDGQQQKEALIMEWGGVNWWNTTVPFGISVISSYTDRAGYEDHAFGIMTHWFNNYSVAVTFNKGENGVEDATGLMLSVDLLKVFEDKKTNFEKYKNKIDSYL